MKLYKKLIILLALIVSCYLLFVVIKTFAKYSTSVSQVANMGIADWNIKVNNSTIQSGQPATFTIQPVLPGSTHIASGIMAPTAEGYFNLALDYTDVDVSFAYSIDIQPNQNSSVSDLKVLSYAIDGGQSTPFNSNSGIGDTIYYNNATRTRTITIYIKWDDSSSASMNNIEDTAATASTANNALLDVTVSFVQVTQ